jgi:AcrR family transcriptional regulator
MDHASLSKRAQKTRLAFMHATLCLIVERGFDRVTVTDIANYADYGRWTFYQYFESKEDAIYSAFVLWMNQLDHHLIEAVKDLESPRREYESWRMIFRACQQHRDFLIQLNHADFSAWRDRIKEFLVQQFYGHIQAGRFALMDGVRPEVAARLYVVSLLELLDYWGRSGDPPRDADAIVDEFFMFIFRQAPPTK